MGDLKTPFSEPAMSTPDPAGDTILSRGGDPLIDTGGSSGLKDLWPDAPAGMPGGSETPNSVSGMPTTPNRWEPPATSEQPPDLTDRNPGTIDRR